MIPRAPNTLIESFIIPVWVQLLEQIRNPLELEHGKAIQDPGEINLRVTIFSHSDKPNELDSHDKGEQLVRYLGYRQYQGQNGC